MFIQVAIAAIGIGIAVMIGYMILAETRNSLPDVQITNPCLDTPNNNSTAYPDCFGQDNTSATISNEAYTSGLSSTQDVAFSGLSLVALGVIVIAAFGLVAVFNK